MSDDNAPELKWSDEVAGAKEMGASIYMLATIQGALGICPSVIVSTLIAESIRIAQECDRLDDMPLLLRRYAELVEGGAYTKAKGNA